MKKIAIVYWSGTGNTEIMAKEIAKGVQDAGADVSAYNAVDFSDEMVESYEKIIFGCPSMGVEELETEEFEPMFSKVETKLFGKEIALFGSYGWGDGEWMRIWQERCTEDGAKLFGGEGLIINETPDEKGLEKCREFGKRFVS